MADEERRVDGRKGRAFALIQRFAQDRFGNIRRLLDEAILHASQTANRDAQSASLRWRSLGPRNIGGRINALIQDVTQPATYYAGSAAGGVWKTTNLGDTWQSLDDFRPPNPPNNLPQALPVGALGVGVSSPNVVYVGTGDPTLWVNPPAQLGVVTGDPYDLPGNGLYWSTNGGQSFTQIDHPDTGVGTIASDRFEKIVVDPWESRRVWVASPQTGLWRGSPVGAVTNPPQFVADRIDTGPAVQRATDVIVDFGDPLGTPRNLVWVYAALWNDTVYRAQFNRSTNSYLADGAGQVWTPINPGFPNPVWRIKLALCRSQSRNIYAVGAEANDAASLVMSSPDRGNNWNPTSSRTAAGDTGQQGSYDLILEVHPRDPRMVITGSVEVFRSIDRGVNWTRILDWRLHDEGIRSQHADQHALVFDYANPRRLMLGNDGGISLSHDLGITWRERSQGILAAQFYDITTHPQHHYVYGGGLQDNGSWMTFGSTTWFHINGGDGGQLAFDPNNLTNYFVSWQGGVDRGTFLNNNNQLGVLGVGGTPDYSNPLPDIPLASGQPTAGQRTNLEGSFQAMTGFANNHPSPFSAVVTGHPSASNRGLIGRFRAAYRTNNGNSAFVAHQVPNVGAMVDNVSTAAYALTHANTTQWTGTNHGQVFRTRNSGTNWLPRGPAAANTHRITALAIHPGNRDIVAFAVAERQPAGVTDVGRVYLTGDDGVNWLEISGKVAPCQQAAVASQLNPSPITSVAFDPASSAVVTDAQTLYVGTLTGVYVIRNALPPAAPADSFQPVWATLNNQLPLVMIQDLEATTYTDGGGTVRNVLRVATHGRGMYELELNAALAGPRLLVRDHAVDTGFTYQTVTANDPRIPTVAVPLVTHQSIDIRVDAQLLDFVNEDIDAVEFDEELRSDPVAPGALNVVFVQVHNNSATAAAAVHVHLYYADAANPATAPDLPADFWTDFPLESGGAWTRIGVQTIATLESAQPRVLKYRWQAPMTLPAHVALLVVVTCATDDLPASAPPLTMAGLIGAERRAALHIFATQAIPAAPALHDSPEQSLRLVVPAWGGQSSDILVKQGAVIATPDASFADLTDRHASDIVQRGVINRVYVRVHNSGTQVLTAADVDLYSVPLASLGDPAFWVKLATITVQNVPARGQLFATRFDWNSLAVAAEPNDPEPASPLAKYYILAAVVVGQGQDSLPGLLAEITDVPSFWRYFIQGAASKNATFRTVRFLP